MKRFSILLVIPVLLLSFSFIVPASAAETDGNYFNVLDYTGLNNTPLTNVTFSGSTQLHFDLASTYGSFNAYSVEFTYSYSGSTPSLGSFTLDNGAASTVRTDYIGNGIYRYRASFLGRSGSYFDIGLTSSGETSINVLAFNVYLTSDESFPLSGTVHSSNITSFSGGESSYISFSNVSAVQVRIENWRGYDSLLFFMELHASPLQSVAASLLNNVDGSFTPLDIKINPVYSNPDSSDYELAFDVDLTSIDRVSVPDSTFLLDIVFENNTSGTFKIRSADGIVFSDPPDPMTKWYQILFFNIGNWFQNLENTVANGFESIEAKIDEVFGASSFEQKEAEINQGIDDFNSSLTEQDELMNGLLDPESVDVVISLFPDLSAATVFAYIMRNLWGITSIAGIYVPILCVFLLFSALVFGRRG